MTPRTKVGRPSLFIPEIRRAIITALRGGASMSDAAAMAGIGLSTLEKWTSIGRDLVNEGKSPNLPKKSNPDDFVEFIREVEKARAGQRIRSVNNILRAGTELWVHRKTGTRQNTPPPPVTWLNKRTGELIHTDPAALDPAHADEWEFQWSGEAWRHVEGQWQANAWYLERTDPNSWAKTLKSELSTPDDKTLSVEFLPDSELLKILKGLK